VLFDFENDMRRNAFFCRIIIGCNVFWSIRTEKDILRHNKDCNEYQCYYIIARSLIFYLYNLYDVSMKGLNLLVFQDILCSYFALVIHYLFLFLYLRYSVEVGGK
jgi:hypothetical protein